MRRRVVRRRRVGGSILSALKSAHKYVKDKRIVSSALRHFAPKSKAAMHWGMAVEDVVWFEGVVWLEDADNYHHLIYNV